MQQGLKKNYNKMKNDFYKKFRSEIVPVAQKKDKKREIFLIIAIISFAIFLMLGSWFLYIFITKIGGNADGDTIKSFGTIILGCILAPIAIQKWLTNIIEKEIKEVIMPDVCKCIGDLTWSHKVYENNYIMALAKLIPNDYNRLNVDDVFMGHYNDVGIDIVEATYKKYVRSGKHSSETIYFQGVFVVIDMNKKFKCHTIIKPDRLFKFEPSGLKRTTLEDVMFEKKYDVFTDDEIEARYLITTSFMDRLNEMKTAFKVNKVSCAFYNKQLIVAFENPYDSFGIVSLFTKTDDHRQYFQMFDEFLSIVKLIDYFKLNEHTGL